MGLYQRQKKYFEKAYETGEHGWPTTEPTPFVLTALRLIRQGAAAAKKDQGPHMPPVPPRSHRQSRMLAGIRKTAAPGRGRILDLGCGEGRHALACARDGFDAVGLDYQPRAIRKARAFARRLRIRRGIRFMVGDAFRLTFRPNRFDGIIDYGCLHHVKIGDTRRYLKSVLPCLKAGGYFILSCFSTRFKHHPGEKRTRNWLVHKGHYDRFFRKQDFKALFGKQFEILKAEEKADGLYVFWHVLMRKK